MSAYVNKIYDFHSNKVLRDEISQLLPIDPENLAIDKVINEWAPKLKDRLPSMRGKLL
jgi:hypothetical protein